MDIQPEEKMNECLMEIRIEIVNMARVENLTEATARIEASFSIQQEGL